MVREMREEATRSMYYVLFANLVRVGEGKLPKVVYRPRCERLLSCCFYATCEVV